ncbi:uncharacterized protein LOC135704767 [Ochlerotatus camptorhynchus]|uniref:uncharacterized protein LOC135704767 n=1 Tax=Ochlerotatus camptorhynchus TaxID=644619 RepID=UPI0031DCE9A8
MSSCTEWCKMSQKNKMQTNALLGGLVTLALGGIYVGSSIFNIHLRLQGWTSGQSDAMILLVVNLFFVGTIIGSFISAFLVDRIEKLTLSRFYFAGMGVASVLQAVLPRSIIAIGFARLLAGTAHGMAYVIVLIHGGEVLVKELRGITMAAVNYILFLGILSDGLISPIVLYNSNVQPARIVGIAGAMSVLFAVAVGQFMSYESPVFLIRKDRDAEAVRSLMKLRLESTETIEVRQAFVDIKVMLREDSCTSNSIVADGNWRPLAWICLGKVAATLSFNAAVNLVRLTFIDDIFYIEVYSLSGLVILGMRALFGIVFIYTVDKYGRKKQQALSALFSGAVLSFMGIVFLIVESIDRYAVFAVFLVYDMFACAGVTLVPDVHLSEAFPTTKKSFSVATVLTVESLTHVLILSIGSLSWDYTDYDFYGIILLTCGLPMMTIAAFLYLMIPETAKLSLRQSRAAFAQNDAIYETERQPSESSGSC